MKKLKIIILLILLLIITGCFFSVNVQERMKNYLEKRYEKKFVVEEPKIVKGNEMFGYSLYSAAAHAVDEPDVIFPVYYDAKGGKTNESYLAQKWSDTGREITKKEIEEIYGCEVYIWNYAFYYRADWKERDFDKIKNLSHNELLEKYGKDCGRTVQAVIFLNRKFDFDKDAELLDKVYEKLFMKDRAMERFEINILFGNAKYKDKLIKQSVIWGTSSIVPSEKSLKEGSLYNSITEARFSKESIKQFCHNKEQIKRRFEIKEEEYNNVNR